MPLLILALLFLLNAGCDTPKPKPAAANATLILWNWPDYMTDEVLSGFTNETGIRIEQRIFGDEEILLGAMQGSDFSADFFIVSVQKIGWLATRQISQYWCRSEIYLAGNAHESK